MARVETEKTAVTVAWSISVGVIAVVSLVLWAGLLLYVHRFTTEQARLLAKLTAHQIDTANALRRLTQEVREQHGMVQAESPDLRVFQATGGAAGQDRSTPGHARGLDRGSPLAVGPGASLTNGEQP